MSRDIKHLNAVLASAHPKAAAEFKKRYPDLPQPFICQTHRSNEEQDRTFFIGRDATGKVLDKRLIRTNARAGQSPHNFNPSFAYDVAFAKPGQSADYSHHLFAKYAEIVIKIEPLIVWGYDWNGNKKRDKNDFDAPHFELKDWKSKTRNA